MSAVKGFIVRSMANPGLILCTIGEFKPEALIGPGGYCAKVYKTEAGAKRVRGGNVRVEPVGSVK